MKAKHKFFKRLSYMAILMYVMSGLGLATSSAIAGEVPAKKVVQEDKTGTDPRGFANKFMPYYLYTELENGLEVQQLNLFGFLAFNKDVGLTYDIPVSKQLDFSDTSTPGIPTVNSYGDLGLRFFVKPDATQFKESAHMFGLEMTLPTATNDFIGAEVTVMSPMYVYIKNVTITAPGFLAFMNFYDFDLFKSDGEADVSRYRGRWFAMIPLAKPGPGLFDGIYLLPELQPVYDFERNDNKFSLWFAPEFGKMIGEGFIGYIKPGWGLIKDDPTDRDFTFELGFRYFM